MRGVSIHRVWVGTGYPYLISNLLASIQEITMMDYPHYPTLEQIHALEMAARRDRARAVAHMFRTAARKLKALIARGATMLARKIRHDPSAHHGA